MGNGLGLFGMTEDQAVQALDTWGDKDQEPAAERPDANGLDIFSRAIVLQLQFRRLGTHRKVKADAIDVRRDDEGKTDKRLLSITKTILEAPELKAIAQHDGETSRWVDAKKAGPAFANQGGFHLVPNALKAEIDAYLDDRLYERSSLVERFLTVLETRIAETRERLGPLGEGIQYPTRAEASQAFGVTREFMRFGYENQEAAARWQAEALGECRAALRSGFADVVSHLAERLTPDASGKPKVFRDSLVSNFDAFAKEFSVRNLADDTELAELVRRARGILAGVDATDLRKRDSLRRSVARSVAEIDRAAAALVMDKPTRLYGED